MPKKSKIHFEISERKILLRVSDVVFVLLSLYFVSRTFDFKYFMINDIHWVWIFYLVGYLLVFSTVFELYDLQKTNNVNRVLKNIVLSTSMTVLFYLLTPFYTPSLPTNRLQILFFYLAIILPLILWRLIYIALFASPRFYKYVAVVAEADWIEKIETELQATDPNYKVIAYLDIGCAFDNKSELLKIPIGDLEENLAANKIKEIIVADSTGETITPELYKKFITLLEAGFSIREYSQVYEELTQKVAIEYLKTDFYKFFPFSRSNRNKLYLFFHRLFDIVSALIGLLFAVVFGIFVAIGNIFGSRGPLFYSQIRVGKNSKPFKILKFRTMVVDAEKDGAEWSQVNDSRITKFGRFLRKTRLDEFPQFFNILKGEMSVIGPRPERPVFVDELAKSIPYYEIRHSIKPGLTGWAQVNSHYGRTQNDAVVKLQYDLYYIKHRGLFLDLRVLLKTLSTVVFFRGQ